MPQPLPLATSWEMILVYFKRRRYVRVINESMIPTLYPGDIVVLHEGAYRRRKPCPNDIVVANHPDPTQPRLIKRIQSRTADNHYFLISDNITLPESRDSRTYGAFPLHAIVGQITSKLPKRS